MACKVKRTPTHVKWEKIRKENERRAQEMKGKKAEKKGKKEEKKGKYKAEEEKAKRVRRGLRTLKEIRKYQSGTKTIDKKIAISEGCQGNCARDEGRPMVAINSIDGLTRGRRNFLSGPDRTI